MIEDPDRPPLAEDSVAFLPATLSLILGLLAFFSLQVYSLLVWDWRWSVVGLIALIAGLCIGATMQAHANKRKRAENV